MNVNFFSIILCSIIIYTYISNKNYISVFEKLLTITVIVTLNIKMGYFIKYNDSVLGYSSFLLLTTAIIAILILIKKGEIPLELLKKVLILWISLLIGYISVYALPYKDKIIVGDWTNYILGKDVYEYIDSSFLKNGYYLTFICIGIIFLAAKQYFDFNNWMRILNNVICFSKINIIVGYCELIIKNILKTNMFTDFFVDIFGSYGAQQNFLILRGNIFSIQGATKEASMYNTSIFYLLILMIVDKNKNNNKWIILGVVLLMLNPSLSAIVYIILFLIICSIIRYNEKILDIKKIVLLITILIGIIIVSQWLINNYKLLLLSQNYLLSRIGRSIEQMHNIIINSDELFYSSESIRFSGIFYDLKILVEKPLFGFGLGTLSCNSGIITYLVNGGIIGFISWISCIGSFCYTGGRKIKLNIFLFAILILPNIFLNDYETILCLVIPLIGKVYGYRVGIGGNMYVERKYKTISNDSNVNIS